MAKKPTARTTLNSSVEHFNQTDPALEKRLRDVEMQLREVVAGVVKQIANSLEHLEKMVAWHDLAIFGKPDDKNSTSIDKRLDRLEQVGRFRHWLWGLAIGSTLTVIGHAYIRYMGY